MIWAIIFIVVIALAAIGFLYLASRFYRFHVTEKLSGGKKKIRILVSVLAVLLILCPIGLTLGSVDAVVCMLHLCVFWLLADLAGLAIRKFRGKKAAHYYAGAFAIIFTTVWLLTGFFLADHVWQTDYTVETDKPAGTLKIIQFADSHIGTTFSGREFSEYVSRMQAQNPDIVLITGDYVDDDTSKEDMTDACAALGKLQTTYGVYFSFGNHDKGYYANERRGYDGDDLVRELEKNGVTVLQDESILIDNRFYVIGRQDLSEEMNSGRGRASMKELTEDLDSSKFQIVMDHQPHDYDSQTAAGVDLVLSGHTHGGQLIPITFVGEWLGINNRTYGMEKRKDTSFIVTSGISGWAIHFKTGCRSEYTSITVKEV